MSPSMMHAIVLCFLLITTCAAEEGKEMNDGDLDKALIVTTEVRDLIEQSSNSVILKEFTKSTAKVAGYGLGGCAAGAFIGSLIFPGMGTAIGCQGGAFLAGVFKLASEINVALSEQMRRAVLAWKIYRRSHKHLKMSPGHDLRKKLRSCAKEVHPDLWPKEMDEEARTMMQEIFADCKFAAQYIKKFTDTYGTYALGDQLKFYRKFAGFFADMFKGPGKAMSEEEINEYLKEKDEL